MSTIYAIAHPHLLSLKDGEQHTAGADQLWYDSKWKQRAGCGPTCCAQLMWYLAGSRPGHEALGPWDGTRSGMLRVMEAVWSDVTPGPMGVDRAKRFIDGALRYSEDRGISLDADALIIPSRFSMRPAMETLSAFLARALKADLPVAFLNLSSGRETCLEGWHWMVITTLSADGTTAGLLDGGREIQADLQLWRDTSHLGGAFVTLAPIDETQ